MSSVDGILCFTDLFTFMGYSYIVLRKSKVAMNKKDCMGLTNFLWENRQIRLLVKLIVARLYCR